MSMCLVYYEYCITSAWCLIWIYRMLDYQKNFIFGLNYAIIFSFLIWYTYTTHVGLLVAYRLAYLYVWYFINIKICLFNAFAYSYLLSYSLYNIKEARFCILNEIIKINFLSVVMYIYKYLPKIMNCFFCLLFLLLF